MNQATNVNVVPSYGQRGELHFSQYDVGRTATINLYGVNEAFSIPASSTVKIQATKPSGLGFNESCTYSGNVVTIVSTETMTEEWGRFPCELQITKNDDIIGTANFMFCVEPSPHPDGTVDGDSEEIINEIEALVLQSEGYALGTQNGVPVDSSSPYYHNNSKWWAEHPVGGGLTEDFKQALLDCFENVAWIGDDGQDYYDALYNVLYPPAEVISISAVYTQGGTVYDLDSLDSLKADLVVTATYDDTSTATVQSSDYTLSGSLEAGESTITVTYENKTTTFTVTVTAWSFVINNIRINNANVDVSTVDTIRYATKLYTTSNNKRAGIDPFAQKLYAGTYTVTIPSGYNAGMFLMRIDGSSPDIENVNYTWDGSAVTFWEGTARQDLSSGWQTSSYTLQVDYDSIICVNFKNTSGTALSSTDATNIKNGFTIVRSS